MQRQMIEFSGYVEVAQLVDLRNDPPVADVGAKVVADYLLALGLELLNEARVPEEARPALEMVYVEVEQIDDIFLDPHIVAWRIAKSLEKGGNFKRIASIMIQRIIQSGARGVEIRLSGKLPSKRAKTWKFTAGNPRKCGQEVMDHAKVGYEIAIQKLGVIGVRVMIIPPHVKFSDEIHFIQIEEKVEKTEGKVEKKEEKVEVASKEELEKEIDEIAPLKLAEGAEAPSKEAPAEEVKTEASAEEAKTEEEPAPAEESKE